MTGVIPFPHVGTCVKGKSVPPLSPPASLYSMVSFKASCSIKRPGLNFSKKSHLIHLKFVETLAHENQENKKVVNNLVYLKYQGRSGGIVD